MHKPLGIFGGTFDPVHFGHLRLAEEATDLLGLSGVRWIPAGSPALREAPGADPGQRLAMVRLAVASNPRFQIDPAEVDTPGPSHTVPTLERLRRPDACGPEMPLALLVGFDVFARLDEWHRWESLFELAHIAVAHRPGHPIDPERLSPGLAAEFRRRCCRDPGRLAVAPAGNIVTFAMTPLDISATRLRALLAAGASPRYLLPEAVLAHIHEHRFYLET